MEGGKKSKRVKKMRLVISMLNREGHEVRGEEIGGRFSIKKRSPRQKRDHNSL